MKILYYLIHVLWKLQCPYDGWHLFEQLFMIVYIV